MKQSLTASQLAIYYESINKAGLPVYVIPVMLTLDSNVDLDRLKNAIETAVSRYPVLSMVLEKDDDGMPCLVPAPDCKKIECKVEEMTDADFEAIKATLPEPMDLNGGHLFETRIFKTPTRSYLYLPFHHIVGDGTTFKIVIDDIIAAYGGDTLAEVPMTIFDVQAAEDENRKSARFDEAKKWHIDTFGAMESDSMPLPDRLVADKEKQGNILTTVRQKVTPLSVDYDKVFALSRSLGVPMSIVLDGAFGYMAGIWNAAEESAFCTIFAGRKTAEEKRVAGMMVKTVPVYCSWNADTTVADYLRGLADQHKTAKNYADTYSFADLCADTGFSPRLNFSYRGSIQAENTVIPGFCTSSRRLGLHTTGDSLLFMADHIGDHLEIKAEYQGEDYTPEFIDSMIDAYDMVLRGFLEKTKLCEIELCSPAMIEKMEAFNTTIEHQPVTKTIVDLFRQHAAESPDKVLFKNDDCTLTYRQVADTAARIAAFITSKGIGKNEAVAVMVDRNEWMLSATMGVLCSGAAYQPLDASYPAQRLNYMMRDADVRLLIADRSLPIELEDDLKDKIQILYTDEIASLPATGKVIGAPSPDDLLILLYTSGTTGLPKGVKLTHANLMALYGVNMRELPDVTTPADVWAVYASFGFDVGFYTLLLPVCFGGAVTVVPEDVRLDMEALNSYYMRMGVTYTLMTTQVGRIFATTVENTSLKALAAGGEKLVPCNPPANYKFINAYGPTEGTVYSHSKLVDRLYTRVPIGLHNDDYKNYIVDRYGRRMPLGALGEMTIAGPQVSEGYLYLPDKTASVFCPNPFSSDPVYSRMYHTGDIVRLLPADGEADIIGRNDGQVKIRGFRIELTEIEQAVRDFPGIKDATVQAFDDPAGGKFIAAYVVGDEPIDIDALNAFIGERKPPYMIPAVTMQIDAIPLNQNQKVNKRALPQPTLVASKPSTSTQTNRKPDLLERQIAAIITEILGIDDVPFDTPLAHLGLTSISSIRLSSQLFKRFGVNMRGAELVKGATVATINDTILEKLLAAGSEPEAKAETPGHVTSAPLSAPQLGVYLDWEMNRDSLQYNIPTAVRFGKEIDADRLADAIRKAITMHPSLRVRLSRNGGEVIQQYFDEEPAVEVHTLDFEPDADFFISQIKPFDLFNDRLYRIDIYKTPTGVYLFRDIHHIVFDGMSTVVFDREIARAYDGEATVGESFTTLDHAAEQAKFKDSPLWYKAEAYYADLLDSAENVAYPHIYDDEVPWQGDESNSKECVAITFDAPAIDAFCAANNLTVNNYFMTCMMEVLHSVTREEKIVATAIHHGREDMRVLGNIGMYVTTLPIVSSRKEKQPFVDNVRRMQDDFTATVAVASYPFTDISSKWGIRPHILFAYQDMAGLASMDGDTASLNNRGENIDILSALNKAKTPIEFNVRRNADGNYTLDLNYDATRYSRRDIETLADMVINVATSAPEGKIKLLSPDQEQQVMTIGRGKDLPYDVSETWVDLFLRQAAATPDSMVVADSDTSLTYSELDSRSNALANMLIARGVKPDTFVCLMLERSVRFPLAVLSIHKAAAAYVPIDLEYPEERQQYMIENSEAKVVLDDKFFDEFEKDYEAGKLDTTPVNRATPDNLAYMIYTSGSTGKPKGAMLHHAGLRNHIEVVKDFEKLTAADRISGHRSFSFDAHIEDMYPVQTVGGSFHVMPSEIRKNLTDIHQFILDHKITGGGYATAITSLLLNTYPDLPVRFITGGGEKMDGVSSDTIQIFDVYGPTECTNDTTFYPVPLGRRLENIPIGRTVANCWNFIVDPFGRLLPDGMAGELCFAGVQVGRGYWRLPERTAQSFGDCPFVTEDAYGRKVRMYHTGDLARWNPEGNIEYLGRIDFQVKLRGFRIELGEIESKAMAIEGVRHTLAKVVKIDDDDHLVIYYVGDIDEDTLLSGLAQSSLTEYMVPEIAVRLEKMPLTPNGKINRKALPVPVLAARTDGRKPETELEKTFVEIFANALNRNADDIFADDNFFKIGGTSLAVMRVIVAASAAGYQLVYKEVFDNPTPEALARLLDPESAATTPSTKATADQTELSDWADPTGYDYTAIDTLLAGNTIEAFRQGERRQLGTVLLTGATGFAGMHVLHELLSCYDVHIVCLGRDSRGGVPAAERIEQLYFYYFGESMSDLYPGRVTVVKGDITNIDNSFDPGVMIDTVINCAANVKHFSAGTDIEDINYYAVLKLIEWCKVHGAALIQTSTTSVTGRQAVDRNDVLSEQSLYIGQDFAGNKYVSSKFMAERAVLQATANGEIVGKVVRLGNLAPRERDGEFQINFNTNGFMNRLKSITLVGCYPYAMYSQSMDISPIDDVARAIVLFAQTPNACVLFHGNNANRYSLGNFYYEASQAGLDIHPVETDEFAAALEEAKKDPAKLNALVGLMAYEGMGAGLKPVDYSNDYSDQILLRMGFHWPVISSGYVDRLVKQIEALGFFLTF